MNTMMAFRRVSTPTTPIVNSTAEKNSASASIGRLLHHCSASAQHDRADDGSEQQHALPLEGEEILLKEWPRDWRDHAGVLDLAREVPRQNRRLHVGAHEQRDLRQHRHAD